MKSELVAEEVAELKKKHGKNILVGSPSMIVALANLGLVDEYQLGVQPTVVGSGLSLFENITAKLDLKLLQTKTFGCGAVFLYYEPTERQP